MSDALEHWCDDLEAHIIAALEELRSSSTESLERFAVDCHPWNGVIALAVLTSEELSEDPRLVDPEEMAAWKHYDFASRLNCLHSSPGSWMKTQYESSASDRPSVADHFFRACAEVVARKSVFNSLSLYRLSGTFRISVPHPDTGLEYFKSTT